MRQPTLVTLRGMHPDDDLIADVRRRVGRLEKFCGSLIGARVLVEPRRRRQDGGNRYRVRIDLQVPDEVLAISHQASARAEARALASQHSRKDSEAASTHKMLDVTIRDAFAAARRRLQDYVRRRRLRTHAGRRAR